MKTASIIGASGAVGQELLAALLQHPAYSQVKSFGRKKLDIQHSKLEQHLVDFNQVQQFTPQLVADDIFICIGTTIKKAKSKKQFRKIDLDIPLSIATALQNQKFSQLIAISSIGAGGRGLGFYLQTKTEMEQGLIKKLGDRVRIVRPSLLLGQRKEFRMGEEIGKFINFVLSPFYFGKLKKYKGIQTKDVAKAMIKIANSEQKKQIFESNELQVLANHA